MYQFLWKRRAYSNHLIKTIALCRDEHRCCFQWCLSQICIQWIAHQVPLSSKFRGWQQPSKPLWRKRWHRVFLLTWSKGVLSRCACFSICLPIWILNVAASCSYFISEVPSKCLILTSYGCVARSQSVQKSISESLLLHFSFQILLFLSNEASSSSH